VLLCLLGIVDYRNENSSSTLFIYARYAAFFEDISTVQYFPVDGLFYNHITS